MQSSPDRKQIIAQKMLRATTNSYFGASVFSLRRSQTILLSPRAALLLALLAFLAFFPACSDDPYNDLDNQHIGDANADHPDTGDDDAPEMPDTEDDGDSGDDVRPRPDTGDDWTWDDELSLLAISPARGPLAGGTAVQLSGTGFGADSQVLFGDTPMAVTYSQGQLVGHTPPAQTPGPVTIRVISGTGEAVSLQNGFTYSDGIEVEQISPARFPTTGGVEMTLRGRGFGTDMGVSFSGIGARRIEVINDRLARVVVPAHPRGQATLRVSIPDDSVTLKDRVRFYTPLQLETVQPATGRRAGGELIRLQGQGFTADTEVYFGDVPAQIQSFDAATGELIIVAPAASSEGFVDILLENTDDNFRLPNAYRYADGQGDALFGLLPATAPLAGGTTHIISGLGLDGTGVEFFIDDTPATVQERGPNFAKIQAPGMGSPGPRDLVMKKSGQEIARLDGALLYERSPTIAHISPASGSAQGGETVHITGQGLSDVSSLRFGGLPAAFTIEGDEKIVATSPAAEPGLVDITLRSGTQSAVAENAYRFEDELAIWSMSPSRGAIAGGTYITLHGRGFDGLLEVNVGQQAATQVRRHDPYTLTFRTPPSTTGPKPVEVIAQGQSAQTPYPFIYFNPMSSFGGAWGPAVHGSVNISVVTSEGSPIPGAFVMLSTRADSPYQGFTDSNGQITLSGPEVLGAQTITATAASFSTYTARHLNAENLTIILSPLEAEGGGGAGTPPPMARISGKVSISGKSTDPGSSRDINMVMVRTTRNDIRGGMLNPGPDSIIDGPGPYTITTRIGDLALIALCGHYEEATDTFTPTLMGVARYLFLSDGQQKSVDLDCEIPLDQSLAIKLTDPIYAPDGPDTNEVRAFLDFGFDGVFPMPNYPQSTDSLLVINHLPARQGPLADLSYSVMAGSYRGIGIPYSQTILEGITDLSRIHSTEPLVAVPQLLDPAPGGLIDGQIRLGLKGQNEPDLFYILLRNPMGLPVWTMVVPGTERTIPLPTFPDFSALPPQVRPDPYQSGMLYGVVYAIRIPGFDFDGFTNRDFATARWSAFAVDTWTVKLKD